MRRQVGRQAADVFVPKRYLRLEMGADFRVRLLEPEHSDHARGVRFVPCRHSEDDRGRVFYDSSNYSIGVWRNDVLIFVFAVRRNRIREGFFPAQLSHEQLRLAVRTMRRTGFAGWIADGLQSLRTFLLAAPSPDVTKVAAVQSLLAQEG